MASQRLKKPRTRPTVNSCLPTFATLLVSRIVLVIVTTVMCSVMFSAFRDFSSLPQPIYNTKKPVVLTPFSPNNWPSLQSQLIIWLRHNRHRLLRNVPLSSDRKTHPMILLLISGIHPNPGPRRPKYPCGICGYARKTGVLGCPMNHKECVGISSSLLARMGDSSDPWFCPSCNSKNNSIKIFTLSHATDQKMNPLSSNPNQSSPSPVESSAFTLSLESSTPTTSVSNNSRQDCPMPK